MNVMSMPEVMDWLDREMVKQEELFEDLKGEAALRLSSINGEVIVKKAGVSKKESLLFKGG